MLNLKYVQDFRSSKMH